MKLDLIKHLMTLNQHKLQKVLLNYLKRKYDKVIYKEKYIVAFGDIPVALVAHMDTVYIRAPRDFFYDADNSILWSPQGLGADDRAGVYAILQILDAGLRPHIIFTKDEEKGGLGAKDLINDFPDCPFDDLKCLIELDRQGEKDSVFYDCNNEDFEQYINSFGFETDWGTFTDISVLAPTWEVAAVNLSIGYYNEHSLGEYLNTKQLENTIQKVIKILNDKNMISYCYIEALHTNTTDCKCSYCGNEVKAKEGFILYNWHGKYCLCEKCYLNYSNKSVFDF